ncbi:DUF192 domain-containing protein [Candidatus Peregrinibacteria bacterium]|nr:DUF192 domain-containing protein [Candidatus Peregrinibacteria bacterium]
MKRVLLFAGILFLAGCARSATQESAQGSVPSSAQESSSASSHIAQLPVQDIHLISPSGETLIVHAEIAATPSEQEQGLMYRTALAPDSGMLFTFSEPRQLTFWMKNTLIPLDVLFFDTTGNFVSFATMTPCTADPCTTYSSQGEALSALEVAAGFTDNHGVGVGWRIKIP